jgi:cell division protein FtsW
MREIGRMDGLLLACILLLCLGGLLMIYSSSAILAQAENRPETAYLQSQTAKLALGLILLALFSRLPYRLLAGRAALWVWLVAALLLVALLLPIGLTATVRGTRRFLKLGLLQLQPAEFARVALIIFLAWYSSEKEEWIHESWKSLVVPLCAIGTLCGLTFLQPNLSSAVLMGGVGVVLLFMAGQPVKRLALVVSPLALAAVFMMKGYQLGRVLNFWRTLGGGSGNLPYQMKQSLIAVGSGGLTGQGIGQGLQKYHYLPFPHTDFILGIVGEETGFLGLMVLFTLYGIVLTRGLRIARCAPDRFSQLLALGLTLSIAMNFFLHSTVVLGLGPVTGVPLPFFSHGGSSLLVNLTAMGILLSISRYARPLSEGIPRAWTVQRGPLRAK